MATILNSIFGTPRGKVGDYIYRKCNGKTVVSMRSFHKRTFTQSDINRQKRFGLNCKLAKAINNIDIFKKLWYKVANGKMSSYNAISKANYPYVSTEKLTKFPLLTPDSFQLDFSESGFCFQDEKLSIEYILGNNPVIKDYNFDNYLTVAGIICLAKPINPSLNEFEFLSVQSETENFTKEEDWHVFTIELSKLQLETISQYSEAVFYFAFISMDKNGNPVNSISTFAENLLEDSE